jgi:hypothetical protein
MPQLQIKPIDLPDRRFGAQITEDFHPQERRQEQRFSETQSLERDISSHDIFMRHYYIIKNLLY